MLVNSLEIITTVALLYIMIYFSSIINDTSKKIQSLSITRHILLIIFGTLVSIMHIKLQGIIVLVINMVVYVAIVKYILSVDTNKAVISTFIMYVIIALSDVSSVIIYMFLKNDILKLTATERTLIGNVFIITCVLIVTTIKPLINLFKNIVNKSETRIANIFVLGIFFICALYLIVYYDIKISSLEDVIIKLLTILILIFLLTKSIKEKFSKNNLKEEFEKMNEYVKIYEEIIEKDRIMRHENKNQLITIKGMISKKDKKTHEYIDSLISDNNDMSNRWVSELKNIPIGGLKGLLFYKVNKMRNSGIDVNLTISRSLEGSKLQDIDMKLYKQLCQIIGVYVDNAIEACMEADIKSIGIEIYKDGDIFEFIISNTYKGTLAVDNIDSAGYTTKGEGHGYGLALVKDIINSNPKFFQNREMINDYYIQHLFLDLTE